MTLGLDFVTHKFTGTDGKVYNIKIWDTAGQERFKTITYSFYKKADGVIMAFDLTSQSSFDNMKNWIDSINQHASQNIPRILVGNKCDLKDEIIITQQKANMFANDNRVNYFETSAKMNLGVNECMQNIFEQTIQHKFGEKRDQTNERKSYMLKPGAHNDR